MITVVICGFTSLLDGHFRPCLWQASPAWCARDEGLPAVSLTPWTGTAEAA